MNFALPNDLLVTEKQTALEGVMLIFSLIMGIVHVFLGVKNPWQIAFHHEVIQCHHDSYISPQSRPDRCNPTPVPISASITSQKVHSVLVSN